MGYPARAVFPRRGLDQGAWVVCTPEVSLPVPLVSTSFSFHGASSEILGKYYYEAKITRDGLCRIGWSTLKASLDLGKNLELILLKFKVREFLASRNRPGELWVWRHW